jgi:hypothetical protein
MEGSLTRLVRIGTSWPALASLLVLIANDYYLKIAYPNMLTGKLSDFSGILLVSLLLFGTFPRHRKYLAVVVVVMFTLWKSPLVDGMIYLFQTMGYKHFGRVVDYTDLIAFLVIPLACYIAEPRPDGKWDLPLSWRKPLVAPVFLITFLAITGTPATRNWVNEYSIRTADTTKHIDVRRAVGIIDQLAKKYDLQCTDCKHPEIEAEYSGKGLTAYYRIENASAVHFYVTGTPQGMFCGGSNDDMPAFRQDLVNEFGEAFPGMELVVPLPELRQERELRQEKEWRQEQERKKEGQEQ